MSRIIEIAQAIARDAHHNQVDRAGVSYYCHVLTVYSLVDTQDEKVVALLHDVLEDSDFQPSELSDAGIPDYLIESVIAMTKVDGEAYNDYLARVKSNPIARNVKIADIIHNMDISRLGCYTANDIHRLNKYKKALDYLIAD